MKTRTKSAHNPSYVAAHSLQQEQSEGGSQATAFGLTGPNNQQEQDEGQSSHRNIASCTIPKSRKTLEATKSCRQVLV